MIPQRSWMQLQHPSRCLPTASSCDKETLHPSIYGWLSSSWLRVSQGFIGEGYWKDALPKKRNYKSIQFGKVQRGCCYPVLVKAFEFAGQELRADSQVAWMAGWLSRKGGIRSPCSRNAETCRNKPAQVIRLAARQLLSSHGLHATDDEPLWPNQVSIVVCRPGNILACRVSFQC